MFTRADTLDSPGLRRHSFSARVRIPSYQASSYNQRRRERRLRATRSAFHCQALLVELPAQRRTRHARSVLGLVELHLEITRTLK